MAGVLITVILEHPIGFSDLRIAGFRLAVRFELRCQAGAFMIATITSASSWILSF